LRVLKLFIVAVNHKVTDLTIACLRTLSREVPRIPGATVAVVENGSGDGAEQRLRETITMNTWDLWMELIPVSSNLGFSGGNNLAIRKAMASADPPQYVLLLNPDTLVPPGAVSALVSFMDEHPDVGIAGSRLQYPDGRGQGTPFRFHGIASEFDRGAGIGVISGLLRRWVACSPKPASACAVDWVAGAAMIVRREVIQAIGPLDDAYFNYFEDMDYCLNARRAGWPTWYVPESRIVHIEGCSSGLKAGNRARIPEYWFQARRRYFLKNHGKLYAALADGAFLAGSLLCRLRRWIDHSVDRHPPGLLRDSMCHSVFHAGFQLDDPKSASEAPLL